MKRRFPCLSYGLRLKTCHTPQVIVFCVIHNFGMESGDTFERLVSLSFESPEYVDIQTDQAGARYRDVFASTYLA
jgi:hypothetical protein